MKLFISYSHDDKAYVKTFADSLQDDDSQHSVWMDRRLFGGREWWQSILNEIEQCECFICVLTPFSIQSIYCNAELNYALELNKPILPLKLKQCEVPSNIIHLQHIDITEMSLERTLRRCERTLGELRADILQGKFAPPTTRPALPLIPEHNPPKDTKTALRNEVIDIENLLSNLNSHTYRAYNRWLFQFIKRTDSN